MVHPPPGVSRDHMGNLDFHSHLEGRRIPPLSHWSDVRGGLAESPDFHHHPVVTRPPTHVVSGSFVGSNKEAPLFLLARVVHRGPVRKEPELPPQPCSNEKPSLPRCQCRPVENMDFYPCLAVRRQDTYPFSLLE